MSAIFICMIVLDKMCLHMLSLCWFKHKKIFKCFSCFWKVFCFYKNWKISKTVSPCFGNSVAGHPSRMLQLRARGLVLATQSQVRQVTCHNREFAGQFWRYVRKWKVQSWGVHREFRGSLAGRPSSCEKHLEIFFKILTLSVLAACPGDLLVTHPSSEKRVFGKKLVS